MRVHVGLPGRSVVLGFEGISEFEELVASLGESPLTLDAGPVLELRRGLRGIREDFRPTEPGPRVAPAGTHPDASKGEA